MFGSYARGEQTPDSDVDIVVELSRPLGFKRAELPDALQSILSVPVDVIFGKGQLYAPVRAEFERDKVALYPDYGWKAVGAMRDKMAHPYGGFDYEFVWDAAQEDVGELMEACSSILNQA